MRQALQHYHATRHAACNGTNAPCQTPIPTPHQGPKLSRLVESWWAAQPLGFVSVAAVARQAEPPVACDAMANGWFALPPPLALAKLVARLVLVARLAKCASVGGLERPQLV